MARKVPPFLEMGERMARLIDALAHGSLKEFAQRLRLPSGRVPRGASRRLLFDYKKGRRAIPESVLARISEVYPTVLAGYLRGETGYMTVNDERDAHARRQQHATAVAATGTHAGLVNAGDIFQFSGNRKVRESVQLLEALTPDSHLARSALHDVWAHVCDAENIPEGDERLDRLRRLVADVDNLMPEPTRPLGRSREVFRLGILSVMLATFGRTA